MTITCPIPLNEYPKVLLAHGSGGKMSKTLIEKIFYTSFKNDALLQAHDGAVVELPASRIAMTTDSFIVKPIFFPGGNIGDLAINGTVNDLAMCGAKPLYLTAGFIIEEGFSVENLWQIAQSMRQAADKAGVKIVTGDTKVVEKGSGDGVFINTSGIGVLPEGLNISPKEVNSGDIVIINGDIGRHGMAVMAKREGLEFQTSLESDTAPLIDPVNQLIDGGNRVSCLRDITRGGLASVLNEIAESAELQIEVDENAIPINSAVANSCEMLGLDPLHVACEGRFIAFVHPDDEAKALTAMGENAIKIGHTIKTDSNNVILNTQMGGKRIINMLQGEALPRIC